LIPQQQGVAKTLWEQVFKDVGLPKKIISDRGSQFVSKFMKGICVHNLVSNKTLQQPTIPKLMVRQRELTKKL